MTERAICLDASFAITLLVPHAETPRAEALWLSWLQAGVDLVSAPLFFAEVTSVLRERVHFQRIAPDEGERAFLDFTRMRVRSVAPSDLQQRAWELAKRYNRPRAYDAQYLAVAEYLGCELWTADRRLINAIGVSWLKHIA